MEDDKVAALLQGLGKSTREMIDAEVAALREEMQLGFDELVRMVQQFDAALATLHTQVMTANAFSGADYRAFLVDEARRMGIRPSDMVKKDADDG